MFSNLFFSKKKMPVFKSALNTGKKLVSFIKPYILNDQSKPAKALVGFRIYYVPAEDAQTGKIFEDKCEREAFVALAPDEAYKFGKMLNKLLKEIYNEDNYSN